MKLYSQHGYGDREKTLEGMNRNVLDGVIFSPRDISLERLRTNIAEIRRKHPSKDVFFDPQFFATLSSGDPMARMGYLPEEYTAYFQNRRRSQLLSENRLREDLSRTLTFQRDLAVTALIAPNILIPRSFDSTESAIAMEFIQNTRSCFAALGESRPVYSTLVVSRDALIEKDEVQRFLNDLTAMEERPDGFYILIAVNSSEARSEIYHADVIAGWMFINHVLALNGFQVINGYSDILTPFLGSAGGHAGATGWWSNLRSFSLDRFVPPVSGGRQPVERYLSIRLLNRITWSELDVLRGMFPNFLNGLQGDQDYPPNSAPARPAEVLQSWEAIRQLNMQLVNPDPVSALRQCTQAITDAQNIYDNTSARGVTFDIKSNNSHLEALTEGIRLFGHQAELEL